MSRYIDAEWIRNVYADFENYDNRNDWTTPIANVLAVIDDAPSINIVFCKECKWRDNIGCALEIVDDSDKPKDDDFCSYGERRTDE